MQRHHHARRGLAALLGAAQLALTLLLAPVASAEVNFSTGQPVQVANSALDSLKAASGGKKLQCSGPPGKKTCTSTFAWVCPAGWNACRLTGETKTCCTQK